MRIFQVAPVAVAGLILTIVPANATIEEWVTSFERFMGGLKVYDRQISVSEQQTQEVHKKAAEAMTNAETAQELAYKVAKVKERYAYDTGNGGSGQGDSACTSTLSLAGLTGTSNSQDKVLAAFSGAESGYISGGGDAAENMRNSILKRIGHYCTTEERNAMGSEYCRAGVRNERGAGDSNAAPFLMTRNYGFAEVVTASDYIDVLAPLPTIKPNATTAPEQTELLRARMKAMLASGARSAIMGVVVSGMGGDK